MTTVLNTWLDASFLQDLASKHCEAYQSAQPFPHIVIDNFLPESILNEVLEDFPKPESIDWKQFDAPAEKKLASKSELQMSEKTRYLLYQFNSSTFIEFLERLTGIEGIIPDPHFVGGGLHQIERGGFLKIHADFNRHKRLKLDRRLNLLLYLNKDWQEEYGGHFELWDTEMTKCEKRILPIFNRCVVFSTTDFSFHGHPEPLTCPEGYTRKSLALYYYTNGRPAEEVSGSHSTIFRARPDETIAPKTQGLKKTLQKLIRR
ncbi:MAG: 2OG-Fe(II) oxygenase [Synechococcales bacterium]|nr:2OG-Fe(II) oxygenase [Synechococcales bacterium]